MRCYQQLGMRVECVSIHTARWMGVRGGNRSIWVCWICSLSQHCGSLGNCFSQLLCQVPGGKHTLIPCLNISAFPWIHHASRVQAWVEIATELSKDWVTVAARVLRRWGREACLRRGRNLRLPLWYCSTWRVWAETPGWRDPLSVQRHIQWHRGEQSTWTWDHFIHLRQEAIKTGGACACWNWRGSSLGFVTGVILVFWAGCSRVCFGVAFSLFFRQGIWFSLSLATEVTIIKHFLTVWVESPVIALSCTQIVQLHYDHKHYVICNTLLQYFS